MKLLMLTICTFRYYTSPYGFLLMPMRWSKWLGPWDKSILVNDECSGAETHVPDSFMVTVGLRGSLDSGRSAISPAEKNLCWSQKNFCNLLPHFQLILNYLFHLPCDRFPAEISEAVAFARYLILLNDYFCIHLCSVRIMREQGREKNKRKKKKREWDRERSLKKKKEDKQTHQNDNC